MIATWDGFLDFDLRNAVSHSDFSQLPGGGIIPVRNMVRRMTAASAGPSVYHLPLIEQLYAQARDFLMAFRQVVATR